MSRQGTSLRLASQGGYTAIEMIITMALTGIMSGVIFSSFVVLDRVQSAWQERDQARAIGVLAEQPLLRDVQAYRVISYGTSSMSSPGSALVLEDVATGGTPLQVTYTVVVHTLTDGKTKEPVLLRTETPCLLSKCDSFVAHGVQKMVVAATCAGSPSILTSLEVSITLAAISTQSSRPVVVSPSLTLTPRNHPTCP